MIHPSKIKGEKKENEKAKYSVSCFTEKYAKVALIVIR